MNISSLKYQPNYSNQKGIVLVVTLILLLTMTLVGVTAMRATTMDERMTGNFHDRNLSFQAAEAALRLAEDSLTGVTVAGSYPGVTGSQPDWSDAELYEPGDGISAEYVIEAFPVGVGSSNNPSITGPVAIPDDSRFRITARSFGGTGDSVVILQTTFER